jgi:deoxyribonuclease-1
MYKSIMVFLLAALVMTSEAQAAGNEWNDSFSKAKKTLERQVYYDHRITLYCGAAFDEKKNVTLPEGFTAAKHEKRSGKVEWEHVVPRRELRAGVR